MFCHRLHISIPALLITFAVVRPGFSGEFKDSMCTVMLARNEDGMAQKRFERLTGEFPESAGPMGGLALTHCRLQQLAQADAELEPARLLDPWQPLVLAAEACLASSNGDFEGEARWLELAADRSATPIYVRELAIYWMRHGQYERADEILREAATSGMQGPTASTLRVVCLTAVGDTDGARALRGQISKPNYRSTTLAMAETLLALAEDRVLETAAVRFDRVTRVHQGNDLVAARAEAMRRLGRLDDAEQELGRRKFDVDDPYAAAVAARLAADLGQGDVGRLMLAEAYLSWPDHGSLVLSEAYLAATEADPRAAELLERSRTAGIPAWDWPVAGDVERLLARQR